MKKVLLYLLAFTLLGTTFTYAKPPQKKAKSETYLSKEEIPDMLKFLPAPPDTTSESFGHDVMRYFWGKQQRLVKERAEIAIRDSYCNTPKISAEFSGAFGVEITEENAPEIYKLVETTLRTADMVGNRPKKYYMRKRPFDRFREQTLTPWDEEKLSHNGSYPSGHTIRGWTLALLLSEIAPEKADTLLARGYMFGDSRVIVGAHWQSDVDAGRLASTAVYTLMHTKEAFTEQMRRAREEYRRLTSK